MVEWNLFIDDIRLASYVSDGRDYELARSMSEALILIEEHGCLPTHIAFDHDLGWDGLEPIEGSFLIAAPTEGSEAPSGYDFAQKLVEFDMEGLYEFSKNFTWSIHSSNPVGAANIHGLLTSYMKHKYNRESK
jgi:hypothetical protein